MSEQKLSRLKNAFIDQYKVDNTIADNVSVEPKQVSNIPLDNLEYEFSDSKFLTFAPSLIISIIVITIFIVFFSNKEKESTQLSVPISTQDQKIIESNNLIKNASDFESVTFLKAKFFDGIETYDLSLPLTLQKSPNSNIMINFDNSVNLSKKKIVIDIGPFEGSIELFLKDSSLQSNAFNPIIIKASEKKQIYEVSLNSLPESMLSDVNLYRIIELRIKLAKASAVTFNSISLQ